MIKFAKFVAGEILNLAIGYLAGLWASTLVSKFFVKKGLVNLWGLAAKREALRKGDYEWLLFFAAYFIGLIVMICVNYLVKMLQERAKAKPV